MGSFDVSASCVYVFMYVNERIFFSILSILGSSVKLVDEMGFFLGSE